MPDKNDDQRERYVVNESADFVTSVYQPAILPLTISLRAAKLAPVWNKEDNFTFLQPTSHLEKERHYHRYSNLFACKFC
ncbi:hypothetical protein TNCV_575021 [Trichonephila clavipes]|nr:hypothetical protein TNCV_575021 [Trichonephila clavipes]